MFLSHNIVECIHCVKSPFGYSYSSSSSLIILLLLLLLLLLILLLFLLHLLLLLLLIIIIIIVITIILVINIIIIIFTISLLYGSHHIGLLGTGVLFFFSVSPLNLIGIQTDREEEVPRRGGIQRRGGYDEEGVLQCIFIF